MNSKDWHYDNVVARHRELTRAIRNLDDALRFAHRENIGYSTLSTWIGQTEGAVRLKFKRRGWR